MCIRDSHDPEVKEQLEKFGVPVIVERSSYESGPLARMEWLKLYGILLNKTEMAYRRSPAGPIQTMEMPSP